MSNGGLTITAYVHDDDGNGDFEVASTDQTVNVKNCNLSLSYRHFVGITQKQEKEQH